MDRKTSHLAYLERLGVKALPVPKSNTEQFERLRGLTGGELLAAAACLRRLREMEGQKGF